MNGATFKLIDRLMTLVGFMVLFILGAGGWMGGLLYFMKIMGLMEW